MFSNVAGDIPLEKLHRSKISNQFAFILRLIARVGSGRLFTILSKFKTFDLKAVDTIGNYSKKLSA